MLCAIQTGLNADMYAGGLSDAGRPAHHLRAALRTGVQKVFSRAVKHTGPVEQLTTTPDTQAPTSKLARKRCPGRTAHRGRGDALGERSDLRALGSRQTPARLRLRCSDADAGKDRTIYQAGAVRNAAAADPVRPRQDLAPPRHSHLSPAG